MRVLIVDDEIKVCNLIRNLVDWQALGLEIVGVANDGEAAFRAVNELAPDIVITDIRMPGYSGMMLVVIHVAVRNPDALSRAVPLLIAPAFGALAAGVILLLVIPYKRLCHIQRMFVSGQLYDELLQQRIELSPEYESVIGYFDNVINKHDVADLSHRQAEYLALQNQINPHFLYNTLEAIRGDALGIGGLLRDVDTLESILWLRLDDARFEFPRRRASAGSRPL